LWKWHSESLAAFPRLWKAHSESLVAFPRLWKWHSDFPTAFPKFFYAEKERVQPVILSVVSETNEVEESTSHKTKDIMKNKSQILRLQTPTPFSAQNDIINTIPSHWRSL